MIVEELPGAYCPYCGGAPHGAGEDCPQHDAHGVPLNRVHAGAVLASDRERMAELRTLADLRAHSVISAAEHRERALRMLAAASAAHPRGAHAAVPPMPGFPDGLRVPLSGSLAPGDAWRVRLMESIAWSLHRLADGLDTERRESALQAEASAAMERLARMKRPAGAEARPAGQDDGYYGPG